MCRIIVRRKRVYKVGDELVKMNEVKTLFLIT